MHRGYGPQPSRAELYAALQRAKQENQHLRHTIAQRHGRVADERRFHEAIADLKQDNATLSVEVASLRESLAALSAENERLQARPEPAPTNTDAAQERAVRLAADIANLRRRQAEEVGRARRSARAELIRDFVETLDVLEQALDSNPDPGSPWYQGTEGVRRQMVSALKRAGVERLGAAGEPFDPHVHEAVGLDPYATVPAEHISKVVQPGYRFTGSTAADALIRAARVIVAR